jgi:hypothetical protein
MGQVFAGQMAQGAASPGPAQAGPGTPPPMPGSAPFFIAVNGQQAGPFEVALLRTKVGGDLKPETLVWRQGMGAWTPAKDVPELAGLFAAPPPMPGGPPPLPR